MAEYPKPFMKISELENMGFSKHWLNEVVHSKYAPKFASQSCSGGVFLIDTEEFDKCLKKGQLKLVNKCRR